MSNGEKLRALLAEARAWMLADAKLNKDYATKVLAVSERINAALAEPVVGCARCAVLERAIRASCGPGCSHEGESREPQRSTDYHAGWAALGDAQCGYCGKTHDAALAAQSVAETPAQHLKQCGPLCSHIVFCGNCSSAFGVCREHRADPDSGIFWKGGVKP